MLTGFAVNDYQANSADFRNRLPTREADGVPISPPGDDPQGPTAPAAKRKIAPTSTTDDFSSPPAPLQVKLPQDLIQSLKLHSISTGKTMSEIVLECLTSDQCIGKAWVSTRRAA